jgi:hypothetical protein
MAGHGTGCFCSFQPAGLDTSLIRGLGSAFQSQMLSRFFIRISTPVFVIDIKKNKGYF